MRSESAVRGGRGLRAPIGGLLLIAAAFLAGAWLAAGSSLASSQEPLPPARDFALRVTDVTYRELPPAVQEALRARGIAADDFPRFLWTLDQRAAVRTANETQLELAYFLLHSEGFTKRRAVDPVQNAREFVEGLDADERARFLKIQGASARSVLEKVPPEVRARIEDFVNAAASSFSSRDPEESGRKVAYAGILPFNKDQWAFDLRQAYLKLMAFLYRTDWDPSRKQGAQAAAAPGGLEPPSAALTDTQVEGVYALSEVLAGLPPPLNNVLIVAQRLEFLPGTPWHEVFDRACQPYAVADALLRLKLADAAKLQVDYAAATPRVMQVISTFRQLPEPRLNITSGLSKQELGPEFGAYFEALARTLGSEARTDAPPARLSGHWNKAVVLRPDVVRKVRPIELNIVERRSRPAQPYDLIIALSAFQDFDLQELLLALANTSGMLRAGGYLIHDETRTEAQSLGALAGLTKARAETIQVSAKDARRALSETFVVAQKQ